MKLYFLQRTELADRVVGAFRVAVVEETEAAELIESKTAIPFGDKRPMPRPEMFPENDPKKKCREMIKADAGVQRGGYMGDGA